MSVTVKAKIQLDERPESRVLALEAMTRGICKQFGLDPAEGVMMLLTAASHMAFTYSKKSEDQTLMTLASTLGSAAVAATEMFKLHAVPHASSRERKEG